MIEWIIGGIIAGLFAATLIEKLIEWGEETYNKLHNTFRGILKLIKRVGRAFRRLFVTYNNGSTEEWYVPNDEGEEINETNMSPEVVRLLNNTGEATISIYN